MCIRDSCESVLTDSGILAVTVGGVIVGNLEQRVARHLGEFQEDLTVGLIGLLFVLLAADVRLAEVAALGTPGLLTVVALALVVRPAAVGLSILGEDFSWREWAFLSWVGPRDVVAAAIASLAAAFLVELDMAGGPEIRAMVFLTIAMTVVIQGGTAPIVARLLGVRGAGRETIVILGAEELAFALADAIRPDHERIVFADSNPSHIREAEARGYAAVFGDAFDERTTGRMRLERARTVIAITANAQVNAHFGEEAKDTHEVPEIYVAVGRDAHTVGERIVEKMSGRVLFDRPKDVERWHVRIRHGHCEVRPFVFTGIPADEKEAASRRVLEGTLDPFLLLAVERGGRMEPAFADDEPAEGARAWAAVLLTEEAAALEGLHELGYTPAPPENTSEAEDTEEPNAG